MGSPTKSDTYRKLTTVFTADVQSYSRLMEADEEGTLATLKLYRDAMSRLIESHGGRVINTWGDGVFAEFPSVVEAVRAAVDIQNDLAQRNAGRPTETRMQFRIGINLGDVIVDGDDLYGDGVNVAARLQATSAPGGIVISNTVYDQVRYKLTVGFAFLGDLAVKNIDHEIPSYAVLIGENAHAPHHTQRSEDAGARPGPDHHRRQGDDTVRATRGAPLWPAPAPLETADRADTRRKRLSRLAVLGVVAVFLVAVNLVEDAGDFWAAWPLLGIAMLAGFVWARGLATPARWRAGVLVLAAGFVGANALDWNGHPWAVWPVLVLGLILALSWARHIDPGHS